MPHDDFQTPTKPSHERDALLNRVRNADAAWKRAAAALSAAEAALAVHDELARIHERMTDAEIAQARANLGGRDPSPQKNDPWHLCGACVGIYLTGYGMPWEEHECV